MRDSLDDDEKEQFRKNDKKRKMDKHLQTSDERSSIFNNIQMCSMTDTCILTTPAFRLIEEDFKGPFRKSLLTFVVFDGNWNLEGMLLN